MSERPLVAIALPHRPGESMAMSLWTATQRDNMGAGFDVYDIKAQPCSLLNQNFNELWCWARNLRQSGVPITDFVMVHSDVCPQPGKWLQTLLEERRRVQADVLSCVIALKDDRGLSSTGIMEWPSQRIRKLSVAETLTLPDVFDAGDVYRLLGPAPALPNAAPPKAEDYCLLLNTGCWVCDFTQDWTQKIAFRSYDTIIDDEKTGACRAVSTGEDWLFGMDCYRLGLRTFALTGNALVVQHQGGFRYPNCAPWGSRQDEQDWGHPWCVQAPPWWSAEEQQTIQRRRKA